MRFAIPPYKLRASAPGPPLLHLPVQNCSRARVLRRIPIGVVEFVSGELVDRTLFRPCDSPRQTNRLPFLCIRVYFAL
jgi:hypothetical protein